MANPLKIDTVKYNFHTKWILTQQQLTSSIPLTTEMQPIEGMPNVKWNLQWNHSQTTGQCSLSVNIESDFEVEYTIYRHMCSEPQQAKFESGCLIGKKEIQLVTAHHTTIANYLVDDQLTHIIHGCFSYSDISMPKISKLEITNAAEWGLRLKDNIEDNFEIVVDEKVIKIFNSFLAAESPVFAKMFENNFKEAEERKVTIIDSKHKIVQAAINYCYGQNIEASIENENDETDLLFFCDKYDFQTLKPKLEIYLSNKLTKENLSFYVSLADQTNAIQLRQACINFIRGIFDRKETQPNSVLLLCFWPLAPRPAPRRFKKVAPRPGFFDQ